MPSCFDDLRSYLEKLCQQDQNEFIKVANEFVWETRPSTSKVSFQNWSGICPSMVTNFAIGVRKMDQLRDQLAQDHLPALPFQIHQSTR